MEKEATLPFATPNGFNLHQGHREEHPCFFVERSRPGDVFRPYPRGERIWDRIAFSETPELVSFGFPAVRSARSGD